MMKHSFLLFLAVFHIFICSNSYAQVIINEYMAFNVSTYPDMCDYDDFSDWIELYNTTSQEVDLTGYYLSDNLNNPKKWAIPGGTKIGAKGFLVIHADGADARPGKVDTLDSFPWDVKFTTKRYHTNFKLSDAGDEIGLYKVNGTTVTTLDSVIFSNQLADISMGRVPGNTSDWVRFDHPTPGAANTSDPKQVEQFSGSVSFKLPGGFYGAAQSLELTASSGDIYYTTDGSLPSKSSIKYTGAITITKNTVVRARCIEPTRLAGKVTTNTYFINEKKRTLMMASITADTSFLFSKEIGVFENSWKGREVPITLELFSTEGKQIVKVNAGMTLGSLTNFTCPQKPLQIACKGGKYGDDLIWQQLFAKDIAAFPRIRLRQGGDAWESNLIADGMLEGMSRGQLDVGVQAYRPVVLFINGNYYGIQDMREQFDDQYFTNNYNADPSTKDEVKTTLAPLQGQTKEVWVVESGTSDDFDNLKTLVATGEVTAEKLQQVKDRINLNSFIDFISAIVFGNQVSWGHNQDLWRVNSTKWQWLVSDFDRCFVYNNSLADVTFNNFTKGVGSGAIETQDVLFSNLIKNTEFKNYFSQRFCAHLNSTFSPVRMNKLIDSLTLQLTPEMDEYTSKWASRGGVKSTAAWKSEVDNMKKFLDERPGYCFGFLKTAPFGFTGTAELSVALSPAESGDIYIEEVSMCSGTDSLTFVTGIPLKVRAVAKPGFVFTGWDNGTLADTLSLTLEGNKTITAHFEVSKVHIVPAEIVVNTTLTLIDNPYVTVGDIVVEKGATLTIQKGVTLLMAQDANILIRGRLLIIGTADANVTIKENRDANAKNWGALTFEDALDTSKITYLTILGTTIGHDPLNERAGINGNRSNVILDHLTMSETIYPFYFEYGHTVLKNSSILIDHICNGGIHVGRGSTVVENNFWSSTGKTINTDAIDIKGVTSALIKGNRLYNFNGANSDGIDLGEKAQSVIIEGNYIYGNKDKGISVGGASECIVRNNIIVGCDKGIGIKDEGSKAVLDHNMFSRNRIAIATYAKAFGRGGGTATVTNCILSSSKNSSIYEDRYSSITLSYCLSDVDILPGIGNITEDPAFVDPLNNNFQLFDYSVCLNRGDPSAPRDADGSITDIGAQYTYTAEHFPAALVPAEKPPVVVFSEFMYNTDKKNQSGDWIEFYNTTENDITLAGWKCTDKSDYSAWEMEMSVSDLDSNDFFQFPSNAVLPRGGYIVIARDITAFKSVHSKVTNVIGGMPFGLSNNQRVLLYNNADSLIAVVAYRATEPWPSTPDGYGPSLELVHATRLNYHPMNWDSSKVIGGTPGKANTASPIRYGPVVHQVPTVFGLAQSFPNPCRTAAAIHFTLPKQSNVKLSLYSISGQLLSTLVNTRLEAGMHKITLDARKYSAGVYFYRIECLGFVKTQTLTIQ